MNGKFNPKVDTIRVTPPLVAHLWVWLNMHQYPWISLNLWKYLNKLFWICQGCEYAWSSYMFDKLLKMPRVLNISRFWMRIMRLYMQGLYRVIMSEYGSICLNVPEYAWTLLNVPEYTWKCMNKLFWICQGSQCVSSSYMFDRIYALGIKYTRVLNMPWYSYNNIIIELMLLY